MGSSSVGGGCGGSSGVSVWCSGSIGSKSKQCTLPSGPVTHTTFAETVLINPLTTIPALRIPTNPKTSTEIVLFTSSIYHPNQKVILVSLQVIPEIMGTLEVLFVSQVFSDNEIQWFAHEFAYKKEVLDNNLDRYVPCQSSKNLYC
jgi:hypothetical protein